MLLIFAQLVTIDKWFPLCLHTSFFTENPSFPALHVVLGLPLQRFIELLGTDLWVHGTRSRWGDVFSKWGVTNPAGVWENRKTYGTIGGMGTNKVRWVNFFQGASNAVEPKDIYTGVSSWPYQRVFASLVRRAGGGATYRSRDPITPSCWIVLRFFMRFLLLPIKKRLALRAKAAKDPPELARCSLLLSSSSNTTRAGPQRLFNPEALQCLLKAEKPSLALTPQDQQDLHDVLRALEVKNFVEVRSWVWAYIPEAIKGRRHGGDDGGFLGRTQRLKMAKVLQEISKRMGVDESTAASVMRKSPDLYATAAKKQSCRQREAR